MLGSFIQEEAAEAGVSRAKALVSNGLWLLGVVAVVCMVAIVVFG
jgi:hypothetical protein